MLDTDTCNLIAKENQAEDWQIFLTEQKGIREIAGKKISPLKKLEQRRTLGSRLYPKLALEGLTREQLEEVDNMVY